MLQVGGLVLDRMSGWCAAVTRSRLHRALIGAADPGVMESPKPDRGAPRRGPCRWQLAALHVSAIAADSGTRDRAAPRPGPEAAARHTVASDDRLIEEIRAGRVPLDDPDPVVALLARWRLCSGPNS